MVVFKTHILTDQGISKVTKYTFIGKTQEIQKELEIYFK